MRKKTKLADWVIKVINDLENDINLEKFKQKMIEIGKKTKDEKTKQRMRNVYKKLESSPSYWQRKLKPILIKHIGTQILSYTERPDIPLKEIENKTRAANCYECSGPLYSEIHHKCEKCGWLICPVDDACGCGFGYSYSRVDFGR